VKQWLITVALALTLTGCVAPVKRNFPEIPSVLEQPCADLKIVPTTNKLSVVLEVVTENYALYRECQIKSETWLEWYRTQKKIFDSVR
jgi:hypothetical protein